jgi:PAS domain S-box-containing protein
MPQITIVNVDDYDSSREATSELLRHQGFAVFDAATGSDGLRLVAEVKPQLVLLDVKLPDISGHDVCRRLKADRSTASIPVLQVSASYTTRQDRVAGLESGADGYLAKPVEPDELVATIKALLRMRDAEEARRETEARYEFLFERNSLPTWIIDLESLEFLAVNEAAVRQYGYSREEFLSMTVRDMRPSEDVAAVEEYLSKISASPNAEQWRHRRKNGTIIDVEVVWHELFYQERHALLVSAKDITERKQAREALRESEARFRMMADTAPVMIWVSGTDKLCTFFNKPWLDFTGRSIEQEMGNGWAENIHPDDQDRCLNTYAAAFDSRERFSIEYRLRRHDGEYRWVLVEGVPRFSSAESFEGYIGSGIDITERKNAESERDELFAREQAAREEAQEASRAKDSFLAIVSHELRAPLNAILGWANILRSGKADEATRQKAAETIERSASIQQKLIEDLLDSARIARGQLRVEVQPVDLKAVIATAIDVMHTAAEAKGIEIHQTFAVQSEIITGDPDRLQQIVSNLLSNAIKFTPNGGRVMIRLERADPHARITMTDTGKGIRPEYLPYVFDRFHQPDGSSTRRHSGLGLGLSLVRHLVELHGGTVSAESAGEGLGATFTVNLPLRAVRAQPREAIPAGLLARESSSLREDSVLHGVWVLVVDDEADARELVATLLEQYGAMVTPVSSAAEAMGVLTADEGRRPDVLVSDVSMPGTDGYALIGRVRELPADKGGRIPAVALTAYGRAVDRIRALSAGFHMHLPKPVEPAELATVIASLTGRAGTPPST